LTGQQNDQAVAKWMPRALGEKQEVVDMISRKRLGLLASHLIQNQLQPDSKESDSMATGKISQVAY